MSRMELRLAGSGGQGIILASIILAEAAVMSGCCAAQTQSYGPEARGGMCKAEVVIDNNFILFPKVTAPTFLMALTQQAADNYTVGLDKNCFILLDDHIKAPELLSRENTLQVPILKTALAATGKQFTSNIVSVGVINGILKLFDLSVLENAVKMHVPEGSEPLNLKALHAGEVMINEYT